MHDKTRNILFVGLFVALEIILTRFTSVETLTVRISFEFIAVALSAILFGPVTAGTAAAAADILGMIIFPKGPYFPGFTLSAFVSGILYGLILYKKRITLVRTFFSALAVIVITGLIMNTVWLFYLYGNAAYAGLASRLVKCTVFLPIQTVMIYFTWKYSGALISRTINQRQSF
ncbi:ECF transporter S component (folate family) [Ruminiclostridium sufflavum DSM 19573]|uniref:ECF transporter S component (Folate family) n=1 Tax=Ruminiclostridium sufflavum DSM 19573 TaxID=1121337 RepID=A0A318Y0A3_9FIRM|nr:folate family ECF transporter S component [Ruminiclostridium sufflavum]PYG88754.1 ECF transporter S component (folate family) [Ruminiclostridium sufflavum DSM 19573]